MAQSIRSRGSQLVSKAQKRLHNLTGDLTKKKAAQLTVSVIEFQKATIGNSINLIGKAQEQTGRILHDLLKNAAWVPSEGREVVDEWNGTMKRARQDFKRTSDKSFDLIVDYLERVQERADSKAPKAAQKTKARPKKAAPRKAAARNAPAKAAAPKKAAKKMTAKKKAPAKKSATKKSAAKKSSVKKPAKK